MIRLLAMLLVGVGYAGAQTVAAPTMSLEFDFPGETPSHYVLTIERDGSGTYAVPSDSTAGPTEFHLTSSAVKPWFDEARTLHFFNGEYASRRNVAFTGTKTLSYHGPEGAGTVVYVYSQNEGLTRLTEQLQQLAQTLQIGRMLEDDLRFHRMGLDADMEALQRMLKGHMASHPEAIASSLRLVANDPEVMQRVSRAAQSMLQTLPPAP